MDVTFYIIAIIAAAIVKGLSDYLLKLVLPKKPKTQQLVAVAVALLVFAMIAAWPSIEEKGRGKKPTPTPVPETPTASPTSVTTSTPSRTHTPTVTPSATPTDTATPTNTPTDAPTQTPVSVSKPVAGTPVYAQPTATALYLDIPETVLVPAGEFVMGRAHDEPTFCGDDIVCRKVSDEEPEHWVMVDAFCIGKYEVTNAQYAAFIESTGYRPPRGWEGGTIPAHKGDYPVANVSWSDAVEYCHWLTEVTGKVFRLPTEAEWEKAAGWDPSNGTKRRYPWGKEWNQAKCNSTGQAAPVGSYPAGVSAYGAFDMAGSVWEWTADWYDAYPGSTSTNELMGTTRRVARGGSFNCWNWDARTMYRGRLYPDEDASEPVYGFRVVSEPPCAEQPK